MHKLQQPYHFSPAHCWNLPVLQVLCMHAQWCQQLCAIVLGAAFFILSYTYEYKRTSERALILMPSVLVSSQL